MFEGIFVFILMCTTGSPNLNLRYESTYSLPGNIVKVQIRVHQSTFLMSSHLMFMLLVLESCFQQQDYRFQLVLDIFWLSFQFFQKVLPVSVYLIHFLVFIFSLVGIKKLMNEKSPVTVVCLNLYCQRQKFSQKPLQLSHSLPIPTLQLPLDTLISQLSLLLSVILCSKNETVMSVSGAHEGQKVQ